MTDILNRLEGINTREEAVQWASDASIEIKRLRAELGAAKGKIERRYHREVLDDEGHRFLAVDGLRGYSTVVELSIARGQVISTVSLHTEEARELARHLVEAADAADRS